MSFESYEEEMDQFYEVRPKSEESAQQAELRERLSKTLPVVTLTRASGDKDDLIEDTDKILKYYSLH